MCDFVHNLSRNPVALQVAEKVALCNSTFRFVPFLSVQPIQHFGRQCPQRQHSSTVNPGS